MKTSLRGVFGLALACALPLATAAFAQDPGASLPPGGVVAFAGDQGFSRALITALTGGDLPGALLLLESRPDIAGTPAGVRLRAELLVRLGRSPEATALLEGHLARESTDAIARFQVGEIHFDGRQDGSAILAYRLALAGDLDPVRRQVIQGRLATVEARRDLRITISVAVAPDSNINNATTASTIDLFGLPFTLSDDARRRSGVGMAIGASVERRLVLSERYALTAGGSLSLLDASNRTFDQSQIGLFVGPELRLPGQTRINLAATYRDIDFGGSDLETWSGLQLGGQTYADTRTRWDASAHFDRIHSQRGAALSGSTYGVRANRTRFLGPSALWRAGLALDVHDLAGSEADYHDVHATVGRLFALPFSSLAYVEIYAHRRTFDQRSSAFGVRRDDREIGVSLRVSKRDWIVLKAFPYVQATASHASSNVALGRYTRQRIEFGLTRDF